MKIINKSKEPVLLCKPGYGVDSAMPVCIDVESKQIVEFPDDEAEKILNANPSLEEFKKAGKKKK